MNKKQPSTDVTLFTNKYGTHNKPLDSNSNDDEKPKSKYLTKDKVQAQQENLVAEQAKQYSETGKESLCKTCLVIIERSASEDGV